jgi:hypothetical protein
MPPSGYKIGSAVRESVDDEHAVIEATGSYKMVHVGWAVVDYDDHYAILGGTHAYGDKMGASFSLFVGVARNYNERGDYKGLFGSITSSAPVGLTVSANPVNPEDNAFAAGLTFTLGLSGPAPTASRYFPLDDLW